MELRHFRYFVVLAEELHFGRAAARLGLSQPPLSQQIKSLEAELGATLLYRTKRVVKLTPAGSAFLRAARDVLKRSDEAADGARRAQRGEVGEIRLGYITTIAPWVVPMTARAFRLRCPGVALKLRPLNPTDQLQLITSGMVDLGIVVLPARTSGLVVEPIRREPMIVAVPEDHPLAQRRAIEWSQLRDVPIILSNRFLAPEVYDAIVGHARDMGVTLNVVAETYGCMLDVLTHIAAGIGVSLVPGSLMHMGRTGVRYIPLRSRPPLATFGVARRDEPLPEDQRLFLEVLRRTAKIRRAQ